METAFLDKSKRCSVANVLLHVLHRLLSTFLLHKGRIVSTPSATVRTTAHHVYVAVATLHGALEWLAMLPRQHRYVATQSGSAMYMSLLKLQMAVAISMGALPVHT